MSKIEIGDVVKKNGCETTGPAAWVTVVGKQQLWSRKTGDTFYKYTVIQPDGSIKTYTDAVLRKMRDVYA